MTERNGIIAIDPGVATGVAWWSEASGFQKLEVQNGLLGFAKWWHYERTELFEHVVCESWDYNRSTGKAVPSDSTDIIGMLKYLHVYRPWDLTMQRPADRVVIPDEELKTVGLWLPALAGHGRDASRHLLRYMRHGATYHPVLEGYGL